MARQKVASKLEALLADDKVHEEWPERVMVRCRAVCFWMLVSKVLVLLQVPL